jgi:RHS repeat-associated protein
VTTLNTYFGGKLIGVVDASGHTLTATDRLGTMRAVNTNGTWAMPTYYPYGEPRTTGGIDGKEQFGTYVRDSTAAQQDYADQRYYSNGLGSFYSPDPGGAATAKARTPLSWNRYSYSYGDPVNLRDLHGLLAAAPKENCGPTWIWDASLNGPCEDDGEGDDSGEMVGGGPIAAPEPPKPDCNALTSAVGFQGLNYTKALEIWDDGSLWADPNGATIAALAAVTWQGETSFSLHPVNNPNVNAQGKVWSVDYGPFQINPHFHSSATGQVIGTNGAGQTFNGDPDANISYGIGILRDLYSQYGTAAAGRYVGSRSNPNAQNRQATFNAWGNTLTTLFSIEECFPHI